jgi:ATP-dependent Clp protease ATP-binding subunit ClpC
MLLQIMEEGRLTDSFGRHVDFRNTILIMTSNIGADLIKGGGGFGFGKHTADDKFESVKGVLMKEIERFFRPEFINRLDDVIVFKPLTKEDLVSIVEFEVGKVSERLKMQGFSLELDQAAKDFLIEKGYNPDFGARPLRRAIGSYIEDPVSEMLLSGELHDKNLLKATHKGEDDFLIFDTEFVAPPQTESDDNGNSEPEVEEAGSQST